MLNRYDDDILNAFDILDEDIRGVEDSEKSLSAFIKQAWHVIEPSNPYIHGWHIDAICEHLEAVSRGEIKRILINVPPGTMKSLLANVFWPAWLWGPKRMHHKRFLCASHMQTLAIRDNIKMRRLVQSDWYQRRYPHVILQKDQNAKTKFENTFGGFREAMAMGSMTGARGDVVTLDDPLSAEDAKSKAILDHCEFVFKEVIPTRLISPIESAIAVIMQRLNERDTSGIILSEKMGYEHLMLPMQYEPERRCRTKIGFEDPRNEDGELLFPARFPIDVVERDNKILGVYGTAGQQQQRPAPRGGGLIQLDWFKDKYYKEVPKFNFIIQAWDTAFKTKQENDYSVCTTWGVYNGGYYLISRYKDKVEFPELKKMMLKLWVEHSPAAILVEDKASGQSLIQEMQRPIQDPNDITKQYRLPIKAINVDTDKVARVNAASTTIEMNMYIPHAVPWVDDYLDELITFPAAAHDDQVDSTTLALLFLTKHNKPRMSHADYFTR